MNSLIKTSLLGLALVSTASMAANFAGPEAGVSVTMNGGTTTFTAANKDTTLGGHRWDSVCTAVMGLMSVKITWFF